MDLGETITLKRKVDKDGNYYYTFSNLESEKIIFKTGGGGKEDEIKFKFSGTKEEDITKDIICSINIDNENVNNNTPNYSPIIIERDNYALIDLKDNYNCMINIRTLTNCNLFIDNLINYINKYGLIIKSIINNKILITTISHSMIEIDSLHDSNLNLSKIRNSQLSIGNAIDENSKIIFKNKNLLENNTENNTEKEIVEIVKYKNNSSLFYYLLNYYYLHEKKKPISQKEFLDMYAKNALIFKK